MRSVLQGSTIFRQESQEIAAVKTVLLVMLLIVRGLRPALSVNRLVNSYNQIIGSYSLYIASSVSLGHSPHII